MIKVTIYHGDCREILQHCRFDLMITDPPYGIELNTDYSRFNSSGVKGKEYSKVIGDNSVMDFSFLFVYDCPLVIWGANNFPQQLPFDPARDGWICWDKRTTEEIDKLFGSPFELAAVFGVRKYEMIRLLHAGFFHADKTKRRGSTEKPVALSYRVLDLFPMPSTVIDPFAGTGSLLEAAYKKGIKSIGIDILESNCEIASNRFNQMSIIFDDEVPSLPL